MSETSSREIEELNTTPSYMEITSSDDSQTEECGTQYIPTQRIDSLTLSQSVLDVMDIRKEKKPWGYLMCKFPTDSSIPLISDEFFVGRDKSKCDYFFDKSLGRHLEQTSRQHFRIIRSACGQGPYIVNLEDLSAGGTLINGILVGRKNIRPLRNRDKISILNGLGIEMFEFLDLQYGMTVPGVPQQVTSTYAVIDDIGRGGFGRVYLVVKYGTGEKLAMKAVKLGTDMTARSETTSAALNEVNLMYQIRHENIVRVHETFSNENDLFIFMEFVSGGDLYHYLKDRTENLKEVQGKFIMQQLVNAAAYLHARKIVHRDIKPLNVLCSSKGSNFPRIKLTDFGMSRFLNEEIEEVHTFCGTRAFAAPEVNMLFSANPQSEAFDARCDVWSLGLILYFCLSKNLPFKEGRGKPSLEYQIRRCEVEFKPVEVWERISPDTRLIIRRMLRKDFLMRPSSKDLLQEPYFVKDTNLQILLKKLASEDPKPNLVREVQDENRPAKVPRLEQQLN